MFTQQFGLKGLNMFSSKKQLLEEFRNYADSIFANQQTSGTTQQQKAREINKQIKAYYDTQLTAITQHAKLEKMNHKQLLDEILCTTYILYIVMLEYRNKVWPYEYMAFARRIGELWEPFCKLAFEYPLKELRIIMPQDFEQVQRDIKQRAIDYINALNVSNDIKKELIQYYSIPWTMVDSGGIKLALDLHFEQLGIHYNCDFKSGFSSNEKGNTNRLLLVASIYKSIGTKEKNLLFVRQHENENNHYLQILKNSHYWEVYCSDECYAAIQDFTGVNIRSWLDNNADWVNDISDELREHLETNDLLKYLTW